MRILLIKTSSMGDVIHTLPGLTDAGKAIPEISFDWVVEDVFSEIPRWHPLVRNVIPVALRRWRNNLFAKETRKEWRELRSILAANDYDLVLDAQGLVKSAFVSFFTRGQRVGLNWHSAREALASLAYQRKIEINFYQHAVMRMRQFFSRALGYPFSEEPPVFNLSNLTTISESTNERYVVFLHGTTWDSKLWPELYWQRLSLLAMHAGFRIKISSGSVEEELRAKRIAEGNKAVDVIPRMGISKMAGLLVQAKAVVAVDTGFGHLAAALDVPTVSLYGSTNPAYTGALGQRSIHLSADFVCSPCIERVCRYKGAREAHPACYASLSPDYVWSTVMKIKR